MRAWSRDMLAGLTLALAPRRSPEAYGSPAHRQRCPTGPFSTSSWARPRPSGFNELIRRAEEPPD